MPKSTSISLGEHFDSFINQQIHSGRYASVSEVVRAGLRMLENNESKLEALRKALIAGEESGIADYSLKELINELDNESE